MDPESLRFAKPRASAFAAPKHNFNLATIGLNIFFPWFMAVALFNIVSFRTHYENPTVTWLLVLGSLAVPVTSTLLGIRAQHRRQDSLWYVFGAIATFLAVLFATVLGNINFSYNMKPYYQIGTLNMYPDINVAHSKGSQMMDAGRVYFVTGTGIDMKRAMGFKNEELYCVAPIRIGNGTMASYDFWAVGKNCCSGVSSDFRCGAYNNPSARAGLRQMRDEERAYYRLAVQQAEAAYGIKATHPLFFHWVQDPAEEISQYQFRGIHNSLVFTAAHFLFNTCIVVFAVIIFAHGVIGG